MQFGRPVVGAVILLAAGWTVARTADVTGAWKARVKNPRGSFERTFVFKQEGNKLTGHIVSPHGVKEEIRSGRVENDEIEFTVVRRQPGGDSFVVPYKGKVKGDEIKGTFVGPAKRTIEWTARRQNRPKP